MLINDDRIWRAPSPRAAAKDAVKSSDAQTASRSPIRRNRPSLARSRGTSRRTLPPLDQVSGLGSYSPQPFHVLPSIPPIPPMDANLPPSLEIRDQSEQSRRRRGERRGHLSRNTTVPTLFTEPSRYSSLNASADEASHSRVLAAEWSSRPVPLTQNFAPALYAQGQAPQPNSRGLDRTGDHGDAESDGHRWVRPRTTQTRHRSARVDATGLQVTEQDQRSGGDENRPRHIRRAESLPAESWTLSNGNVDGLGDRERSFSPDGWDTMLSTIAPDRHLPTEDSSFTSAVASASFSASDSQVNSQVNSRSSSAASSRTHLTIPSSRQTPVNSSALPCIIAEDPGSETEADDDNIADNYDENMDLDPDRTPQLGANSRGVFHRSHDISTADSSRYRQHTTHNPHNSHDRRRSRSQPYSPAPLPQMRSRPAQLGSAHRHEEEQVRQQQQRNERPRSRHHPDISIISLPVDAAADAAPPPPLSTYSLHWSNDEDANADIYAAIDEHNNSIIRPDSDSSDSDYVDDDNADNVNINVTDYSSGSDNDNDLDRDNNAAASPTISGISTAHRSSDAANRLRNSHAAASTTSSTLGQTSASIRSTLSASNNNNNNMSRRGQNHTDGLRRDRDRDRSSRPRSTRTRRDPFLEWAAGEASTQLERLRCIIDELAHRDDIPDEWWMSIGLTRNINMDLDAA